MASGTAVAAWELWNKQSVARRVERRMAIFFMVVLRVKGQRLSIGWAVFYFSIYRVSVPISETRRRLKVPVTVTLSLRRPVRTSV